jgi:hypothetical protein
MFAPAPRHAVPGDGMTPRLVPMLAPMVDGVPAYSQVHPGYYGPTGGAGYYVPGPAAHAPLPLHVRDPALFAQAAAYLQVTPEEDTSL